MATRRRLGAEGPKELENRFTYHKPKIDQVDRYHELREMALMFAQRIEALVPESRERSLAIMKIEEACFWANAGIAL